MTVKTEDTDAVLQLAEAAYMADDFGPAAWRRIATFLLREGHALDEAAAIMLSKHPRWADDSEGSGDGRATTSTTWVRYYRSCAEAGLDWAAEGRQLSAETFGDDWADEADDA